MRGWGLWAEGGEWDERVDGGTGELEKGGGWWTEVARVEGRHKESRDMGESTTLLCGIGELSEEVPIDVVAQQWGDKIM